MSLWGVVIFGRFYPGLLPAKLYSNIALAIHHFLDNFFDETTIVDFIHGIHGELH